MIFGKRHVSSMHWLHVLWHRSDAKRVWEWVCVFVVPKVLKQEICPAPFDNFPFNRRTNMHTDLNVFGICYGLLYTLHTHNIQVRKHISDFEYVCIEYKHYALN